MGENSRQHGPDRQNDLTVVIQAGGESRRMGRSKALVPFLGEPLSTRGVRRFAPIAGELVVTTNEPDKVAPLVAASGVPGVRLVADAYEQRGALKGLFTALQAAQTPFVAVIAVDMAFASPDLVVAELEALRESDADVAIPHVNDGFEPFHAVYRRSSCLSAIKDAIDHGIQRASGWFTGDTKLLEFTQENIDRIVPAGDCFDNANTPTELERLEYRALAEK